LLDQGIVEMETLLARYQADGAKFLDGIPKELLPGLHYLGNFGGSAMYCLNTGKELLLVDAPGDEQLVAFLTARFQKLGWEGRKVTAVLLTSIDAEATGGLAALVQHSGCSVVTASAGEEEVRRLCPAGVKILPLAELEKQTWSVQGITVKGRGRVPVAYRARWAGKTVLASGRIPLKTSQATMPAMIHAIAGPDGNVPGYLQSLATLSQVHPDLWLPALPVHGQNANLYDQDWLKVLGQNQRLLQ
jgi:hypothetical protein